MTSDVRDILELETPVTPELTKESFLNNKKRSYDRPDRIKANKRPEGMAREVYALLCDDNKDATPLMPADSGIGSGYKQKAKLGMKSVRKWEWAPFTNQARTDGAVFHHWRRTTDENREYPFAQFNKKLEIPTYTASEFNTHLRTNPSKWTKAQTDHLFDLANRFDLRFVVMHDRWDRANYGTKSIEDLKERYYEVVGILQKLKGTNDKKLYHFDAAHERKRKEQLNKIFERTPKQVEEEQMLVSELKKIEMRKKERERKTQDLQKLISQADQQNDSSPSNNSTGSSRKYEKKLYKKKVQNVPKPSKAETVVNNFESAGIKFPDSRGSGVSLRSQKMKLPTSIGQKKAKVIEAAIAELKLDPAPPPTEEICNAFNELRSDILLLYELRTAFQTCKFELESLKHQYEAECPGKTLHISESLLANLSDDNNQDNQPPDDIANLQLSLLN